MPAPTLLALAAMAPAPRVIPQLGSTPWLCFQRFMSLHASRPLDNADLCESLYSTVQEQYIVIQGLRHHNLVP